ncbi:MULTISPECIES: ATP-binding protein [Cysteiniphilum]|uniref:ATP-binding protein n=2 Tax=Fastidiosibacteraceae TaxID=2056687 RepID=UPI0017808565|nr:MULTISPECIES: ATP-binding protein [Cysteiniphilum]
MLKNVGIRGRMILLTLLPTLTVSALLGFYFISMRFSDLDRNLYIRGEAVTTELVAASEYGLYFDSKIILQNVTDNILSYPDVRMAAIYDSDGDLLTFTGRIPQVNPHFFKENSDLMSKKIFMQEGHKNIQFLAPVISRTVNPKEKSVGKLYTEKDQRIGWVVITLSRENTIMNQYQAIITTLLIVLIGLTVSILFGLRLSGDLINPLFDIINAVKRIKEGALDTKLDGNPPGELKNLEEGVNSMALSLNNAHQEMQRNIKQATRELRHTLKTIERQNVQLDQARKEAIEASEIKSKFLANMSHEIRTPMNGVLGFLDLLAKSNLSSLQREYLETIILSSNNLLSIINDILDFSKIESGNLILEHQPFNLREEITNCMMLFKPKVIEQQIDFGVLLDPHLPQMVMGDALRFCQILTNLVSNALKFTEQGSVCVNVDLKATHQHQVEICIKVKDTGIGLSQAQINKLFHAFTQADLSTSRKYGGTGLGLTISKTLIEKMGGEIHVESKLDQGACFNFNVFFDRVSASTVEEIKSISVKKLIVYSQSQYAGEMFLAHIALFGIEYIYCDSEATLIDAVVEQDTVDIVLIYNTLPEMQKLKQSLIMDLQSFTQADIFLIANMPLNELFDYTHKLGLKNCLNYPYKPNKLVSFLESSLELSETKETDTVDDIPNMQAEKSILIVDDNPINLKLLHILLKTKGYAPVNAFSAKEALSLIEKQNFRMVLTDVHMPEMDGVELCHALRQDARYRDVPIIAVTADVVEGQGESLLKEGFDAIQIKPIDDNALSELLMHYLGNRDTTMHVGNAVNDQHDQMNQDQQITNEVIQRSDTKESKKYIDIELASGLAGGNIAFAKEMLAAFMNSLSDAVEEIVTAYENSEGKRLRDLVHKLHGGASYCGVPVLKNKLANLEKALQHNNYTIDAIVLEKYEQFIIVCDKTIDAYHQYNQ